MVKHFKIALAVVCVLSACSVFVYAEEPVKLQEDTKAEKDFDPWEGVVNTKPRISDGQISVKLCDAGTDYMVGIDDVIEIVILQPEKLAVTATVSPDGNITFPYIGSVQVKGQTLGGIQNEIQARLADGYMKYPVVVVTLKESRSKKFFVYGEVIKPGTYFLEENTTVLKAITMAGGFTKYGSSSRVKILRTKKNAPGYDAIKVNMKAVMNGASTDDVVLEPDDIIVISEGIF